LKNALYTTIAAVFCHHFSHVPYLLARCSRCTPAKSKKKASPYLPILCDCPPSAGLRLSSNTLNPTCLLNGMSYSASNFHAIKKCGCTVAGCIVYREVMRYALRGINSPTSRFFFRSKVKIIDGLSVLELLSDFVNAI
jgi:hypothetical protein